MEKEEWVNRCKERLIGAGFTDREAEERAQYLYGEEGDLREDAPEDAAEDELFYESIGRQD